MNELVSVIMPVYNAEKYIDEAINSVLKQTYTNYELIIINDNSSDNSLNIINKYIDNDKVKIVDLKENNGVSNARNEGIKWAKGKYIAFLDSDDIWIEDKLNKQLNIMKNENSVFSFTGFCYMDMAGKKKKDVLNIPKTLEYKQALKNTIILTSTVIIDVSKVPKEIIYMPNVGSEDTATWWNILRNGFVASGIREVMTYYRIGKKSLSNNKFISVKRTWNLYRKVERISCVKSLYYFTHYVIRAVLKRI